MDAHIIEAQALARATNHIQVVLVQDDQIAVYDWNDPWVDVVDQEGARLLCTVAPDGTID